MIGYVTRQYQFIQTQFRGAHMHCSCYAANKNLTKLRTKKPVRDRYDIYNSVAIVKLSVTTTGVLQYSKPGIVAI